VPNGSISNALAIILDGLYNFVLPFQVMKIKIWGKSILFFVPLEIPADKAISSGFQMPNMNNPLYFQPGPKLYIFGQHHRPVALAFFDRHPHDFFDLQIP
jgi:hypothetical protein